MKFEHVRGSQAEIREYTNLLFYEASATNRGFIASYPRFPRQTKLVQFSFYFEEAVAK